MKRGLFLFVAAALAAPLALAPSVGTAQAQRDWTRTVVETEAGGFRMGNPAAPIQVVEYVSLTCPHCRNFSLGGGRQLVDNYVRSGRVSFEIRSFPLDALAAMASQLNRCAPPAHYFALNDAMLAAQEEWFGRLQAVAPEQLDALGELPEPELRVRVAAITGLDALAIRHGLSTARVRSCLEDEAGAGRLTEIRQAAEQLGVQGTPSFTINGRLADQVHDWASLEPLLQAGR